jgi:hypothetical protein
MDRKDEILISGLIDIFFQPGRNQGSRRGRIGVVKNEDNPGL